MRYKSITSHLKPYVMLSRRKTTINHMFAASVAPHDKFQDSTVRDAIFLLQQNPDQDLRCVYCGAEAETWDHIFATVKNGQFSGYGNRIGNLLPCCGRCNSRKGNKEWSAFLHTLGLDPVDLEHRHRVIANYIERYTVVDDPLTNSEDTKALHEIYQNILRLMEEGDRIAARVRQSRRSGGPL